ncbi:hypothetical protein BD413DRAFT_539764 [Trametes elegans]|nr:hypothetical protein BD413DRAFT_539764 [Trametes elegans]
MAPPNVNIEHVQDSTETLAEDATHIFTGLMHERRCSCPSSSSLHLYPRRLCLTQGPSAIALVGGDMSLLPTLSGALLRALLLTPGVGDAFTARNENGELVGYAVFSLPGQLLLSTEEQKMLGFLDFIAQLSPEGRRYYTETVCSSSELAPCKLQRGY